MLMSRLVQVYVSVFADGPTRVLRFSDEPSTANVDTEQSILDLAARLKQVLIPLHAPREACKLLCQPGILPAGRVCFATLGMCEVGCMTFLQNSTPISFCLCLLLLQAANHKTIRFSG